MSLQYLMTDLRSTLTGDPLAQGGSHVLVAAMPKSGSTWLTRMLTSWPGMKEAVLVPDYDRREQELDTLQLLMKHRSSWVSQMHIRASEPTLALCRQFDIKPVVLVRNVHDVVVSLSDHWDNEATAGPMAYVDAHHVGLNAESRYAFITEMVLPWYINFYVSWSMVGGVTWVDYDELVADTPAAIARITRSIGLSDEVDDVDATVQACVESAAKAQTRANVGISGRGAFLPNDVKRAIARRMAWYPHVDFSRIGGPSRLEGSEQSGVAASEATQAA